MSESETKAYHIHGLSVDVIKSIKVAAAELGITVAEVIARAMAALKAGR